MENMKLIKVSRNNRQDDSLYLLRRLIKEGYNKGIWTLHENHPEYDICDLLEGRVFDLNELVSNLKYNAPIFEVSHPNCFKDTEIYTNEGWKNFEDLNKNELVYTLNQTTHLSEWQKPTNYIEQDFDGELINLNNKNFSSSTTPNHRWYINRSHTKPYSKRLNKTKEYKFITSEDFISEKSNTKVKSGIRIPISVNYENNNNKNINIGGLEFTQNEYAKLMGWYLSEGNVTKTSTQITISQNKHNEIILNDLTECLNRNNINVRNSKIGIEFNSRILNDYLSKFGYSYEKYIPEELKNLNKEAINCFIDAYVLGDGHIGIKNTLEGQKTDSISRSIFTSSKRLADDLTEIILKAGYSVSYKLLKYKGKEVKHKNGNYVGNHDIWKVNIKNSKFVISNHLKLKKEKYKGKVYCVSVPNETILVRKDGKVYWSGNCLCRLICYSTTDKSLDHIIVDWKGEAEVGRKVDKKDKKERSKDFYNLYNKYREKFDTLKNDKYLTGSESEPEDGIYTFPIVLDESYYYNPASKKKVSDEILNIILDQADKYSVNVINAELSGADYEVQLEHPLSIYDYSKSDLMDLSWTLEERTSELTEVMHELDDITNFLKTTQNKINELLINYENNLIEPQQPTQTEVQQDIPEQKTEPVSNVELEKAVEQNKPNVEPPTTDRIKSFEDIPKFPEEDNSVSTEDNTNGIDNEEEIL